MNELIKNNPWLVAIGAAVTIAAGAFFTSGIFKNNQATPPSPVSQSLHEKVRIQVLNDINKKPLSDVQVYINSNSPVKEERTDTNGYVEFQTPTNSEKVKIKLQKNGFKEEAFTFDLKGDTNQTKEYYLTPTESKKISQKLPPVEKSEPSTNNEKVKKNR
jgi:hypothetical protein